MKKYVVEGKIKMDKKALLAKAVDYHGHIGVFLAVGLRMGLLVRETLGGDGFNTKALVKTDLKPPRSCLIDGVQVATGCTLGKMNIKVEESSDLVGIFTVDDRKVEIEVRQTFLEEMKAKMAGKDRHHLDDLTEEVMNKDAAEIFELKKL